MGASSLKKKVKTFRNQGSTPSAINHMKKYVNYCGGRFEWFEAPRLWADSRRFKTEAPRQKCRGTQRKPTNIT